MPLVAGWQEAPPPLHILLPWPISVNQMWRAVKRNRFTVMNILTPKARKWRAEAEQMLLQQGPRLFHVPVSIDVELSPPTKRLFDLDNRLKCIIDLLVQCAVIQDDNCKIVKSISVRLGEGFTGALVTVSAWQDREGEQHDRGSVCG